MTLPRPLLLSLLLASPALAQADSRDDDGRAVDPASAAGELGRFCGVVRRPMPSPPVRPFVSLADLAPQPAREVYAVSVGGSPDETLFVIDGVIGTTPASDWFRPYGPVLTPTGLAQQLWDYPTDDEWVR